MRIFWILWKREVASAFQTPMAWVILFFLMLITGFNFYAGVTVLNHGPTEVTVVESFFNTIFFWIPFLLLFPLLTMRTYSEEYRSGTVEPLMTAPVRDTQVVLAKFFGTLFLYVVLWLPTAIYFVIFWLQTRLTAAGATGAYLGTYFLLLLMGMFYLSLGCLCSSLTRHQVTAAVMSFAIVSLFFLTGLLTFLAGNVGSFMRGLTVTLSPIEQMTQFSRGIIDTRAVVWYLVMTALSLFLTLHSFQARRWRK
jgi:ABC-2 type transport system permease protein